MMIFVLFVLGTVAGSVANAVIYRLPRGKSWMRGRSQCPDCEHELSAFDLIPIFSYLFLRGRCRYCHSPIPIRYLLVELFLGSAFTVSHLSHLSFLSYLIIWVMTVIAVMDWESMLVSDWLVGSWLILVLLSMNYELITMNLLGAAVAAGVIGGMWVVSKGKAMGSGDIEIAAVMGLMLGWPKIISALWLAFVLGGVYGIWQLAIGKKKMKSVIPFGPFLILGTLIAYVWGEKIIRLFFK